MTTSNSIKVNAARPAETGFPEESLSCSFMDCWPAA
jgi:hypothetical protein